MKREIHNVELAYLSLSDYDELKKVMITSYGTMANSYWQHNSIKTLINIFPEGQIAIKVNGEFAGCALSIIIDSHQTDDHHTYKTITDNYTFDTHTLKGDTLYGIDVFIKP